MKLVHLADVHIGVENYGRVNPQTGLHTRLEDFLRALDEAVEYALTAAADLVVFAGDAFKTKDPTPTQQREFARRINRLAGRGIPCVLVVGNHDMANRFGEAHALDIYDTLALKNIHVASRPDMMTIPTRHGIVQVATLPWASRSGLLTGPSGSDLTLEAVDRLLAAKVRGIVDGLAARVDPEHPALLSAHVSLDRALAGSEAHMMIGRGFNLSLDDILRRPFAYVALGHIHKHQSLHDDPPVVYSGSVERVDFGEEKEDKGFVVVDFEGTHVRNWEFIKLSTRPMITVKVDTTEADDPTAAIVAAINRQDIAGAICRVIYTVQQHHQGLIDERTLLDALRPAHAVSLRPQLVVDQARTRQPNLDETASARPLESMRQYLALHPEWETQVSGLLERTETLLERIGGPCDPH